ncbi:phospholipase effector Tle1 domain-containing protein [Pseudomonas sp. GCM10022186]|uniref:phospholipase effector Tle1 domain-containing protein n=1 Tax=Pseudomonas sp. GCM10022186 TaxID=3252650 RepID=UPI003606BBE1
MNERFNLHPQGPTPHITPLFPQCLPRTERCEIDLQIGIFFDGTGNNQDWDEATGGNPGLGMTQRQARKDSNVVRLYRAYPEKPLDGHFRLYVPGVGTPFPEIGEDTPAPFGAAMGSGGDGRINYALLRVLDFIQRGISDNRPRYSQGTLLALCRNGTRTLNRLGSYSPLVGGFEDSRALDAVGMRTVGGLLCHANGERAHAEAFYRQQTRALAERIALIAKPKLVDITIDVFGFSRGAAQARVFCNWLNAMFVDGRLCGVPTRLRFLGIFDTVASVGVPNSAGGDGHFAWAKAETLRIPANIHQCVHYIAMHENRASFPLESVRNQDGSLPRNCQQFALPGMHSDVGGGYLPQEQGRGPSGEPSDVLSQIPLELMYQAAREALVPLDRALAMEGLYDPFEINPNVHQAYDAFMAATSPRATTAQWLIPYLAWRYQVRTVYAAQLSWVKRANVRDHKDLAGANRTLLEDIAALEGLTPEEVKVYRYNPQGFSGVLLQKAARRQLLAPEAADVLTHLKAHSPLATAANPERHTPQAFLFANYLHDSYAGFRIAGRWELQGYLRYRRVYRGSDDPLTNAPPTEQQQREAAQREYEAQRRAAEQHRHGQVVRWPLVNGRELPADGYK